MKPEKQPSKTAQRMPNRETKTPAEDARHFTPAPGSVVWLRTVSSPRFYVHELRGVCFVSFVAEGYTGYAACFPTDKAPAETWRTVIGSIAGCELEAIEPGSPNVKRINGNQQQKE